MSLIRKLKPSVPKRFLFFEAAVIWSFAGGMLLFKGFSMISALRNIPVLQTIFSFFGGVMFYLAFFSRISKKHVQRLIDLKIDHPCLFSFFNWKSYILMSIMISSGVLLKKSGIVSPDYLSLLYITMGTPLFFSAFRFYYAGFFK